MKQIIAIIIFCILSFTAHTHPWEPKAFVIIDTDGGLDDMRAITLMLADPSVRVVAIIASDGVLPAGVTYKKIKSLLKQYHHEGILTGVHSSRDIQPIQCKTAFNFSWGPTVKDPSPPPSSADIIKQVFNYLPEKVTWVSLGSLATASNFLKHIPDFEKHIREVVWSADGEKLADDFNYRMSPQAYQHLEKSGIALNIICGPEPACIFNKSFLNEILNIQNGYARTFYRSCETGKKLPVSYCDDETALWIKDSSLFIITSKEKQITRYMLNTSSTIQAGKKIILMLKGPEKNKTKVLAFLPEDTSFYREDIQPIVTKTIQNYGYEEWYAAVLASEFHRHLGVFSIIGIKMGIRAREYFGAGLDEITIVSHAGSKPPVSCMNDGLQASTGATLGHGLIRVVTNKTASPTAEFTYMGSTIRIDLKDKVKNQIVSAVRYLKETYGLTSNEYWDDLRKLTIDNWSTLDRNNIFIITSLKKR